MRVHGCALGRDPEAEIAGEVSAAGEAAAEWLGRRVVVPRLLPCGECDRCRRGRPASCPARASRSGLATHENVPARFLVALDGTPPLWKRPWDELWKAAALADAAAAPYAALCKAGVGPGDRVAIVGDGVRARLAAALVRAKGAVPVEVDAAGAPAESDVEFAIEVSGRSAGRHRALAMLAHTIVFLDGDFDGVPVPPPDWARFCARECRLLGCEAAHPDLIPELCALDMRGELSLDELVTPISPSEIPATLAARRAGRTDLIPIVRLD